MNCFNFTGHTGQDATQRFTGEGLSIVSFSVAVKAGYGKSESTTWVKCSLFGKKGESLMPYLKKGTLVGVSGEAAMKEWTDKEGVIKTNLEVRVNDVTLLSKSEGAPAKQDKPAAAPASGGFDDFESSIPF